MNKVLFTTFHDQVSASALPD